MNTLEIELICRSDPVLRKCFGGVLALDQLPDTIVDFPKCFCINTDNQDKPGMHWFGIYFDNPNLVLYFDSHGIRPFGRPAKVCFKNAKHVVYNKMWLQSVFSKVCGVYVIYFLSQAARGVSLSDMLQRFQSFQWRANDTTIMRWFYGQG